MNTGPEFSSPGGGPSEPAPDPHTSGFFPWIRSLDLHRRSQDRWFAGIAGAIGDKAGIDPLIVRGIFVVLTVLGGTGIMLYLIGWLMLPDESGKIHLEDLVRGRARPGVVIALVVVGLWLVTQFTGGTFGMLRWDLWNAISVPQWRPITFTRVLLVATLIGAGYLVHLAILQHGKTQRVNERLSSWSAQYARRHEQLSLGRVHSLITVALALIAAGVAALVASPSDSVLVAALLAGTAVVALSMILAGIRGKKSGGIGFLGVLGVIALSITTAVPGGTTYHAFGHHSVEGSAPTTIAFVGDTTVDLDQYDRTEQTHLDITQFAGEVTLQLPKTRPAHLIIDVGAGTIEAIGLDWREQSGVLNRRTVHVNDNGPGEILHVHVRLFAGTVIVESAR